MFTFQVKIPKNMRRFLNNLFQSFASNIITLVFPLITIPFIIGKLGVDEYGRIVIAQAVVAVFSIIIEFGSVNLLSSIFSKTHSTRKKFRVFFSSITLRLSAGILITLILFIYLKLSTGDPIIVYFVPMLLAEVINPTSICLSLERASLLLVGTIIGRFVSLVLIFTFLLLDGKAEYVALSLSLGLLTTYCFALIAVISEHRVLIGQLRFRILKSKKIVIALFLKSLGFAFLRFTNMIKEKSIVFVTSIYLGAEAVAIYDIAAKIVNILNIPIFNFSNHLLIWKRKIIDPSLFSKLIFSGAIIVSCIAASSIVLISDIYKFFEVSLPGNYIVSIGIFWTSILITYVSSVVGNYYLLGLGRSRVFIWTSYSSSLFLALSLSYVILVDSEVTFLKLICAFILTNLFEMIIRLFSLRPRWSK